MTGASIYLNTPLSEADARSLQVGDEVYLSGRVLAMCYPWQFIKMLDLRRAGKPLPIEMQGGVVYHCPASYVESEQGYRIRFVGATTSSKFNQWTPALIREFGIRGVIGKGGMDLRTLDAFRECGAVYFAAVGGCSALYTKGVASVVREIWPQPSRSDNVLELELRGFGPLLVAMDSHGRSLYEDVRRSSVQRLNEMLRALVKIDTPS
ncbi:MAG TPA: hypothetical protein GXX40_01410 [Firmicutes bacterium]|nr:hypothetical protein [Bacillota bacterium]